MIKSLKNLKAQFGDNAGDPPKNIHKHSIYMQSKDKAWINKNVKNRLYGDEPIEEDIRD